MSELVVNGKINIPIHLQRGKKNIPQDKPSGAVDDINLKLSTVCGYRDRTIPGEPESRCVGEISGQKVVVRWTVVGSRWLCPGRTSQSSRKCKIGLVLFVSASESVSRKSR